LLNIFFSKLSYQVIEETFYYGVSNFQEISSPFTIYETESMHSTTELFTSSTCGVVPSHLSFELGGQGSSPGFTFTMQVLK